MNCTFKWTIVVAVSLLLMLGANFVLHRARPLEQQVMGAGAIAFVEEDFPSDGGSRVFLFRLPYRQPMALLVLHRDSATGGNAELQEIRISRDGSFKESADVPAGSALEAHILKLLGAATVEPGSKSLTGPNVPTRARLKWLTERIGDRRSKW